jgi:hypothetical protein
MALGMRIHCMRATAAYELYPETQKSMSRHTNCVQDFQYDIQHELRPVLSKLLNNKY